MSKIALLILMILCLGFIGEGEIFFSKRSSVLSYHYSLEGDTTLIFQEQAYVSLNKTQAIRFILDSLSNENILAGITLRFHEVSASVLRNEKILYIDHIADELVPYLLTLFEDKNKDWAANIFLYHKCNCAGRSLLYYIDHGNTDWQDRGGWLADYEQWKNWDWEKNAPASRK